jgi:hypothetical protein
MESKIKYYNFGKGWGWIENPLDTSTGIYFHISNVIGEVKELFEMKRIYDEPIIFEKRISKIKAGQEEAYDIKLNLSKRAVGYVTEFENGFGNI